MPLTGANAERYRALFESMDEGFCIIEFLDGPHGPLSDYIHVEANPAYERNAGIPDVVGQKVREMVPDEADGWVELYGSVLATGEPIQFQRELVATGRQLEVSSFRVGKFEDRLVAVLFKDVTARVAAERALRELNETLERRIAQALAEREEAEAALRQAQKMEAVGQLTGGLAHDFNNLLAGISGAFEMIGLRLSQGRDKDVERYLAAGLRATSRAAALTHRLLAFSRRQTLTPAPASVATLLVDFAELVQRTVGPAYEVIVEPDAGTWPTLIDANQLENALLNLCINARDAMPDGGRITIGAGNEVIGADAARDLELEPGDYTAVSVSDHGAGIDGGVIERVFDPFFTTKPIGQGTGLGLSMVYGFARQSGGSVRIVSRPGEGTEVRLYLPRHHGEVPDAPVSVIATGSEPKGAETVLVIDDEPALRMLMTDSLADLGHDCLEAADGPSGLELLRTAPRIDLLVTDVGLPGGLNGRQVADAARQLRPGLKVLFVTGYAEAAVMPDGELEPGMAILTKPFAIDDLSRKVEALLRGEKAPVRAS